jgi:DHA1 family L-arabinose/isopropyl-beta-D-thiogalactopyranoside export protein-like MFS transporter/DHA1 family inner membrane transport protein
MGTDTPTGTTLLPERTALPTAHPASSPPTTASGRIQTLLCLSAFLAALNFFAPTPFYPQMARDLQTTVPLLGQVVTLMALISAGLGLLAGPLADRYGYRWPLVIGLLAIAVGLLGTGLAPTYPVLLGLGVVMGFGDALAYSLPFAIAATYFSGLAQRRAIAWTTGALSMAPIIGVPLLTAVGGLTSWRVALAAAGTTAAAVAWFVAAVLPADRQHPSSRLRIGSLLAAYKPLLQHPPSLRFFGVSGLRGLWWVGLLTYMGAFLGTVVGFSPQHVGLVYALAGGAYTAGSIAAGSLLGGLSPRLVVAVSSVIGGAAVAPMFLFPIPWVVLPLLLTGSVAAAVSSVSIVALLADESPAGAGTTMVLNGSVLNLGTAGGAILGGALIAFGGYTALGIGLPLFALVAAALAWWPGIRQGGSPPS